MARSARDITMFLDAVLGSRPYTWDFTVNAVSLAIPDLTGHKLRVGIMMNDGVVVPHPPLLRALKMAKEKLLAAPNVEVVDYVPYDHDRGYTLIVGRI